MLTFSISTTFISTLEKSSIVIGFSILRSSLYSFFASSSTSILGNNGTASPKEFPSGYTPHSLTFSILISSGFMSSPSCLIICLAVSGINGAISTAILYNPSTRLYITVESLSFLLSSFARFHGSHSSMYLFILPMNFHISFNASENWNSFM